MEMTHVEILMPERKTKSEKWVGVHSLKNMPKSFKPQEPPVIDYSSLIDCIRAQGWTKKEDFCEEIQNRNRMTILFCAPGSGETQVLKQLFKHIKKDRSQHNLIPLYKIILLDAKNSASVKQSFKKVVRICLPHRKRKVAKGKLLDGETVDKIYKEMNIKNGPKDQSLFVFVGAESLSGITPFLPKEGVDLPFCQFFATTSSKTSEWESEELQKWTTLKRLLFETKLIGFDRDGVFSASKLPASFQPVHDFIGRDEIMDCLAQRFQNDPKSLTVISGVKGNGKTELVKKFLSAHPNLFAKVVLVDANNQMHPLQIFAHNSGIHSESAIEGTTESEKIASLHSEITKNLQANDRVLFVFDDVDTLQKIKNYLPNNFKRDDIILHVIATSRSRNWQKEEDVTFYKDAGFDFREIPLFDGLSLEETHEFCSEILPQNGILYLRSDLERSIREFYKLTGGFPPALQNLNKAIFESSKSNPELAPKLHILNFLRRNFQQFRHLIQPFDWKKRFELSVDHKSAISQSSHMELRLLQIVCLMDPEHLDLHMICYLYFDSQDPFQPPPQQYEPGQVERVKDMLYKLEMDSLIQVVRRKDDEKVNGNVIPVRVPAFLRESMNAENTDVSTALTRFFYGLNLPHSSWTRPLDVHRLWPHILSLNESYTRFHGYHNQVLIECIQNHLKFWKNPPKDGEMAGEEQQRPQTDYETEKEKVKKLMNENPEFKRTFGDFSQVEAPGFLLPILFLILFMVDVGSDLNNARIMYNAEYYAHFGLSLFLVIFPFGVLCKMHYLDRKEYNIKIKKRLRMSWWEVLRMFAGTFDSYFLRLWYTLKFRRETENLEKGLLYERLCVLRANAEYHGIAEAFMESLPQLLLQFPLYLLSYTEEYSELRKIMIDSLIPFELGLVVSLGVFGLALTKLESVYFGWNINFFGIKLLGYRIIHLLINVTHVATLVFCSGILSVTVLPLCLTISLVFNISATIWISSDTNAQEPSSILSASLQPGFVEKWRNLDPSLKHEYVSAKLGHDVLFLRRRPRNSDIIYLYLFFCSVLISAFTAIDYTSARTRPQSHKSMDQVLDLTYFGFSLIKKYSIYFILWLPVLFMWQVMRQLLNLVYLKCFKVPPLTEDYILNDPEGIFRYPADSERLVHLRLYHQMRQNEPSALGQTWTQVKQPLRKFNMKNFSTKLGILMVLSVKFILASVYFLAIIVLLGSVAFNFAVLIDYYESSTDYSSLNSTYTQDDGGEI